MCHLQESSSLDAIIGCVDQKRSHVSTSSMFLAHKKMRSFLPLRSWTGKRFVSADLVFVFTNSKWQAENFLLSSWFPSQYKSTLQCVTYRRVFRLAMAPEEGSSTLVLNMSLAPADTAKSAEWVLLTIYEMKWIVNN